MRRSRDSGGFSIIEVVFIIVVIGAFFSGLAVVLSNTTMGNMDLDLGTTAVFLARETMAETKAQNFDDVADVALANFGGGFARYSYQVDVDYVDPADLDTAVVGPTEYKKIVVTVTGTGWAGSIVLTNLKTDI